MRWMFARAFSSSRSAGPESDGSNRLLSTRKRSTQSGRRPAANTTANAPRCSNKWRLQIITAPFVLIGNRSRNMKPPNGTRTRSSASLSIGASIRCQPSEMSGIPEACTAWVPTNTNITLQRTARKTRSDTRTSFQCSRPQILMPPLGHNCSKSQRQICRTGG